MAAMDVEHGLSVQAERLRTYLDAWLGATPTDEDYGDAHSLLDALTGAEPAAYLPRCEALGQQAAERDGDVTATMTRLRGALDALSAGLDAIFDAVDPARASAQARLARLAAEMDAALVRGYQQAIARDRERASEQANRQRERLGALEQVNAATNSSMDLSETLDAVARTVAGAMGADLCSIFLFDETRHEMELRATNGPRPRGGQHFTLRLGEGYSGTVAQNGKPLLVRDAAADPHFASEATAYAQPYHGLAAIPIIYFAVERLIGVLNVQTVAPREFAPEDINFLEVVAGQLAMNIENGRLYAQTDETMRRKEHELSTLQRVSELVASSLELKAVLETIVTRAVQLSGAERSILFEMDQTSRRLRPIATHGFDSAELARAGVLVGQCCAGRALKSGEPESRLDCLGSDTTCFFHDQQEARGDLHAVLCVPLVSTHGAKGALCVYSPQRYHFSTDQLQSVMTFANVAAIAMDNARLFEQTREGLETNAILVREMHHRVKNNLNQVGSILRMQRRRVNSPQVERILGESLGRIQGIAETHDLLSRESTEQLAQAAIDEIVRKIAGVVQGNNLVPPGLDLHIDIAPFPAHVPSEQATILAIVLNELIANAIEHGFEGRAHGHLRIGGEQRDGTLFVRVADDGAGPPPNFDPEMSDGLGLSVIRKLVGSDLHGTFTIRRMPAAEVDPSLQLRPPRGEREPEASPPEAPAGATEWTVVELAFPALLHDAGVEESERVDSPAPPDGAGE